MYVLVNLLSYIRLHAFTVLWNFEKICHYLKHYQFQFWINNYL